MSMFPVGMEACYMQGCMEGEGSDCIERWRRELASYLGSEADADAFVLAYTSPCLIPDHWDSVQVEVFNNLKGDDIVDAWMTANQTVHAMPMPGVENPNHQVVVGQRDYTWYIGAALAGAALLFAAKKMR